MDKSRQALREIDFMVAKIIASMSLKEKALIANMHAESLPYLQYAFDVYISREAGDDPEYGQALMERLWQTLRDTHRIRLVSSQKGP